MRAPGAAATAVPPGRGARRRRRWLKRRHSSRSERRRPRKKRGRRPGFWWPLLSRRRSISCLDYLVLLPSCLLPLTLPLCPTPPCPRWKLPSARARFPRRGTPLTSPRGLRGSPSETMRKFNIRKVLDGLTAGSSSASQQQQQQQHPAGNREPEIQETLQSEHFQLCKVNGARSPANIGVVLGDSSGISWECGGKRTPVIIISRMKGSLLLKQTFA